MTDRAHRSPATPISRLQQRFHLTGEAPGLCALEDYTYLAGESAAMRLLRAQLRRVAPHFRFALISGEQGTGKEVVALALHRLSAESDVTFLPHTASSLLSLVPELLNNGQSSGLTNEQTSVPSKVQSIREPLEHAPAEPGPFSLPVLPGSGRSTLFLADVASLAHSEQINLLRALQRMATVKNEVSRPRMIFASDRDLRALSGAGQFNRNLYKRISAVEIVLPPLRSRPEDIPLITCGLLSRSARSGGMSAGAFDGRALSRLQSYDWPGNIRELEHVVDYARQQAGDGVIEPIHLPPLGEFTRGGHRHPLDNRVERLEDVIQGHVLDVLLRCSGNKVRAAERLGISRSTLYRMLDAGASQRAS